MYESISKNNELENEMTLDMSYFWYSDDATSVYVCEWNKEFWENTIAIEFILEWDINGATASLSLLNTSGSVAMDRYQWLSNTYACHYMLTFTASHTQIV